MAAPGLRLIDANAHPDTGVAQTLHTPSVDPRMGVENANAHVPNAGGNDGVRTGRRAALKRTGLKGHVEFGALGGISGLAECHHFSMCLAGRLRGALADHSAVPHDNSADRRVRRRASLRPDLPT